MDIDVDRHHLSLQEGAQLLSTNSCYAQLGCWKGGFPRSTTTEALDYPRNPHES